MYMYIYIYIYINIGIVGVCGEDQDVDRLLTRYLLVIDGSTGIHSKEQDRIHIWNMSHYNQ
jgi:uncharacterized protein YlxP (DUF503 family)